MNRPTLEQLELARPEIQAEFERALYAAFVHVTSNRLVRGLWQWNDEERRIRLRVPYEDQRILVFRDDKGAIATAMAVNVVLRRFQSSAYGFSCPADRAGCCELLALFVIGSHALQSAFGFRDAAFAALHAAGFHTAYATTATHVLRFYRRMGAREIAQETVQDERRHFLEFDLGRFAVRETPSGSASRSTLTIGNAGSVGR